MSTSTPSDARAEATPSDTPQPGSSRRRMLRLAGAAVAGAAAATVVTKTGPVGAADGNPLVAGADVDTTPTNRNDTGLIYTSTETPQVPGVIIGTSANANIFTVRDERPSGPIILLGSASASSYPAAVGGYSYRTVANGLYGYTAVAGSGAGVVGFGAGSGTAGVLARGARANVALYNDGDPAPARTDAHERGDLLADRDGRLWYCTASGTPGTWVNLSGGAKFYAITPNRVYDSRAPQPSTGPLTAGGTRTLSVADARDLTTGAVTTANLVPAGATAITANVTVVNTVASGFLAVNPGGTTTISAATVNWYASGQILNNGVTITINPTTRAVTVVAGGSTGAATDLVIDVTGYYL